MREYKENNNTIFAVDQLGFVLADAKLAVKISHKINEMNAIFEK